MSKKKPEEFSDNFTYSNTSDYTIIRDVTSIEEYDPKYYTRENLT